MVVKNFNHAWLFCFPLDVTKQMSTVAEIKCFQLIWLKCCYNHSFENITITKRDRERVALSRDSYTRGLESLEEQLKIINVDRHSGHSNRISVNTEFLDKKSKDSVLKGREA